MINNGHFKKCVAMACCLDVGTSCHICNNGGNKRVMMGWLLCLVMVANASLKEGSLAQKHGPTPMPT